MSAFETRNEELKNGEWKRGWHDFCLGMKERYYEAIEKALTPAEDDRWYRYLGSTPISDQCHQEEVYGFPSV